MESPQETFTQKLEIVLNSFLVPGFCKANFADFELLSTYLAKKEHKSLLETPVLPWIKKCITLLLNNFDAIHHTVISLMFKLSVNCAENEWLMISLREMNLLQNIVTIVENNLSKLTASNKLGHIRLLTAISKHNIGLRWIKESKSWIYLVTYCNQNHTLYVVREASDLIYNILFKFSTPKTYYPEFCLEIIREIMKPIHENIYENTSTMVYVDDADCQNKLAPSLDLISLIFLKTVESSERTPIVHWFDTHHQIVMHTWKLAKVTHKEFFLGKILKTLTMHNFAMLIYKNCENDKNKIDPSEFNEFGVNFFNIMKFCVSRRSCVNFLKLAKINHVMWKKLGSRAPLEIFIENDSIQFENQLIMFHLMPVLCIVKTQAQEESIFDQYTKKLFSISSEFTVRICYSFRDILLDCPDFAIHLAYKSIHGVISMKSILNKDQAVVLFQALVYVLKEFTIGSPPTSASVTDGSTVDAGDPVQRLPQVLYATLTGLYTLIEGFAITWKESIESMCLMDIVLEILNKKDLQSLTVIQAIKLAQLTIEHFLSPNMALLDNNIKGSGLQKLAPIIIRNFHNIEWEVRDSTLELTTSIVTISRLKFPAFQQYVLENNLCSIVFDIIRNDQEFYVRASGLKCLTRMIAVNLYWDKLLSSLNLAGFLLEIILNESEGIVRKEAIICVTHMYLKNRLQTSSIKPVFSALAIIGIDDLYWEVKVAALIFWESVINMLFVRQGMIDGTFPSVTFSKEAKKIVTLTETEITTRILKILNELSQIGCLNVILNCLSDDCDCDLEVVKVAVRVVRTLFQKLDKYSFYEKVLNEDNPLPSTSYVNKMEKLSLPSILHASPNNETSPKQQGKDAESVINEIFALKDSELLANCLFKQTISDKKQEEKTLTVIKPKEFIMQIKKIDLDKVVEIRKNWFHSTESLSTLLDDIILASKTQNQFAECY